LTRGAIDLQPDVTILPAALFAWLLDQHDHPWQVIVACALAWVLLGIRPAAAETADAVAHTTGNAAHQNARRLLKSTAEAGEPDTGKQQMPFYLGPVTVNVMPPASLAAQKELVFWESIKVSRDARDFEDFLKHFPDSEFASLLVPNTASPQFCERSHLQCAMKRSLSGDRSALNGVTTGDRTPVMRLMMLTRGGGETQSLSSAHLRD
jgi:hypothetical protein